MSDYGLVLIGIILGVILDVIHTRYVMNKLAKTFREFDKTLGNSKKGRQSE